MKPQPADEWLGLEIRRLLRLTRGWPVPGPAAFETKDWTWIKLAVLDHYIPHYLRILRPLYRRLVFVDLFAGSGASRYSLGKGEFCSPGSSLVAASYLDQSDPEAHGAAFDRIVAVEQSRNRAAILEDALKRFGYSSPGRLDLLEGDCNKLLDRVLEAVRPGGTHALVFADPEGLDLQYSTLQRLLEVHPAADVFVTHLVAGAARVSTASSKMESFYGRPIPAGLGTREAASTLYEEQFRRLRRHVDVLTVQKEIRGYSYDLLFGVRDSPTHSEWRKRVSALKPKLKSLTGEQVRHVLETELPHSLGGRATRQQKLGDGAPVIKPPSTG
ncbi:MAG TPA: three-Cys-motif partner protein TcmP [Thermoplasmata archaeon]|nr:three-Cys-motif partner protein TcmP [Thermoplasmata archaeon]